MATAGRSTVVGVFPDRQQAERAMEELARAGFTDDQVGYLGRGDAQFEGNTGVGDRTPRWNSTLPPGPPRAGSSAA
jgi:hypothetical protein